MKKHLFLLPLFFCASAAEVSERLKIRHGLPGCFRCLPHVAASQQKPDEHFTLTGKFASLKITETIDINLIQDSFMENRCDFIKLYEALKDDPEEMLRLSKEIQKCPTSAWKQWLDGYMQGGGSLLGGLFYPYPFMLENYRTNFRNLNQAMRLGVIISARHGNPAAQRMLLASIPDMDKASPELWKKHVGFLDEKPCPATRLTELLSTPFITNNLAISQKLSGIDLKELLDSLAELPPVAVFNLGCAMRFQGQYENALACFTQAAAKGMKSGHIATAFLYLDGRVRSGPETPWQKAEAEFSRTGAYGLWQTALCFRYGKGVERSPVMANEYYLKAVRSEEKIPGLFFDCGDFCAWMAEGQDDPVKKGRLRKKSEEYFKKAGELGMGDGYKKAAKIVSDTSEKIELYKKAYQMHDTRYVLENLELLGIPRTDASVREMVSKNEETETETERLLQEIIQSGN